MPNGKNPYINIYFIPHDKHKSYDLMEPKRRNLIQPQKRGGVREVANEVRVMGVGQERKHVRRGNGVSKDMEAGNRVCVGNC